MWICISLKVTDVPQFKPWPRFPETTRDMALIMDNQILWKEIREEILSLKEPLIEEIELFDLYSGRPIPEGKKNLGVRIHYRSTEKTLSDELSQSDPGKTAETGPGKIRGNLAGKIEKFC